MDGSNVFFYFLIYGRLNGLELEEEEFSLYFSQRRRHVFLLRFDLFIFVNILSLGYLDLQIRKRNNFDYRKILLFEYKEKRKDSPRSLLREIQKKIKKPRPRRRTDIVPRVPLSIVRAYFELVGVVKQIFGMVFLFRGPRLQDPPPHPSDEKNVIIGRFGGESETVFVEPALMKVHSSLYPTRSRYLPYKLNAFHRSSIKPCGSRKNGHGGYDLDQRNRRPAKQRRGMPRAQLCLFQRLS